MDTNCNIYNGSRALINDCEDLQDIAEGLDDGMHLLAVFDNGDASFNYAYDTILSDQFFQQEAYCLKVGANKLNRQMIVFVEVSNSQYKWTLLYFKDGEVQVSKDIDNLDVW